MIRFDFLHDARSEVVDRVLALRVPRRFYPQLAVTALLLTTMIAGAGVQRWRLQRALATEIRLQQRVETTHDALTQQRLQARSVASLLAMDRRLRDIRLSGSLVAARLARLGNAFSDRAWATSLSAGVQGYAVKARARDLPAVSAVLARIVGDARIGRGDAVFRMTRDESAGDVLEFDFDAEGAR